MFFPTAFFRFFFRSSIIFQGSVDRNDVNISKSASLGGVPTKGMYGYGPTSEGSVFALRLAA